MAKRRRSGTGPSGRDGERHRAVLEIHPDMEHALSGINIYSKAERRLQKSYRTKS